MTTCRQRTGLAFGTCGGTFKPMTLWEGGVKFRRRLYCSKCGCVGSDKSKD